MYKRQSIDRGLFSATIYHTEKDEDKKIQGDEEIRCRPDRSKTKGMKFANYDKLNENLEILKTSVDSKGRSLEIIEIEMSYKRLIPNDDEPSSYINFYIANNGIVMPSFDDDKSDKNAQSIIQSVFPKRKVIAINGIDISLGGGNIHCITQQQPLSI